MTLRMYDESGGELIIYTKVRALLFIDRCNFTLQLWHLYHSLVFAVQVLHFPHLFCTTVMSLAVSWLFIPTCPAFHRHVQLVCRRGMAEVHLHSLSYAAVVVVGGGGGDGLVIVVAVVVAAAAAFVVQNKCGKWSTSLIGNCWPTFNKYKIRVFN